jgi:glycosyltransferase involved in cell wall biosynthesis
VTPRLLLLTTYPLVAPRHGGQVRAQALANTYQRAGFEVLTLAVVEKGAFSRHELGPRDVEFPADDPRWFFGGRRTPGTVDLQSGQFARTEPTFGAISTALPERLDVIHLEQPFLLPLALRLMEEPRFSKSLLVYGSQNIEAPLREAQLRAAPPETRSKVTEQLAALEAASCKAAPLSLAVSPADQQALYALGAREVALAPNGVQPWSAAPAVVELWKRRLGVRAVALFVASAHPPNIDGFEHAFGDALGCVPPDCRVVVAGSAGPVLAARYARSRFKSLNASRLVATGPLRDEDLSALKELASVFLLPIFEGGGSNIKTAEALTSGRAVIATTTSLRGFESYRQLTGLTVADTPQAFRRAVSSALTQPPTPLALTRELRAKLTWEDCLSSVPVEVSRRLSAKASPQ